MFPFLRPPAASEFLLGALLTFLAAPLGAVASEENSADQSHTNQSHRVMVDVKANVQGSLAAIRYAFLTIGGVKHSFIVPEGYRVDLSHPAEIKLISDDQESFLTVTFKQDSYPNTVEASKAHIQETFSDAEITGEAMSCIVGGCGPVIDFQWKANGKVDRSSRAGFFLTASGGVKISLTASPARFQIVADTYNQVLQTFRTSTDGKFDFVAISDKP